MLTYYVARREGTVDSDTAASEELEIAQRGTVRLISTGAQARKARLEKLEPEQTESMS